MLDQLYGLYMDVIDTTATYRGLLWSDISDQIEAMEETVNAFDARSVDKVLVATAPRRLTLITSRLT